MSEKQRLNIRALEPGDADFMYEVENDSSAWRYSDTVAPSPAGFCAIMPSIMTPTHSLPDRYAL